MLGAFDFVAHEGVDDLTAQWLAPGILGMPATIAVLSGVIGVLFVLGILPVTPENDRQQV